MPDIEITDAQLESMLSKIRALTPEQLAARLDKFKDNTLGIYIDENGFIQRPEIPKEHLLSTSSTTHIKPRTIKMAEWISVNDRLPKDPGYYFVIDELNRDKQWNSSKGVDEYIGEGDTHWYYSDTIAYWLDLDGLPLPATMDLSM